MKSNYSGLLLLALLLLGYWLGLTVFSATAKLIIGLAQPAAAELIVANSLSRCISPHAHMEEIKLAKLIQTCRFFHAHRWNLHVGASSSRSVRFHVHFHLTCPIFLQNFVFLSLVRIKPRCFFFPSSSSLFLSLCPHGYIIEEDSSRVCCKIEGTR